MYEYAYGILTTAAIVLAEHVTLYRPLQRWPLVKFVAGTLAILAGCAVVAQQTGDDAAFYAPLACAVGGGALLFAAYGTRWLVNRMVAEAETRGWLKGLADKGDIHNGQAGE